MFIFSLIASYLLHARYFEDLLYLLYSKNRYVQFAVLAKLLAVCVITRRRVGLSKFETQYVPGCGQEFLERGEPEWCVCSQVLSAGDAFCSPRALLKFML